MSAEDKIKGALAERPKAHGDFTDVARVAQSLKDVMRRSLNWDKLTDVQREALEMVQHKVARICSGNPNHEDHWVDGGGYFGLAANRLASPGKTGPSGDPPASDRPVVPRVVADVRCAE